MVEVDLDHEIGSALNESRIFMITQRSKSRCQFFGNDDSHI
jgi:hypothetical protein